MIGYFVVTIVAAIVVFMLIGFVVSRVAFGSMAGLAGGERFLIPSVRSIHS